MTGECPNVRPGECPELRPMARADSNDTIPVSDIDSDKVPDESDKCPREPQPSELGCPLLDGDGDEIPDLFDNCPQVSGDYRGCPPPDGDNDGIPDLADRCPSESETKNGVDDNDGCPETSKPARPTPKEFSSRLRQIVSDCLNREDEDYAKLTISMLVEMDTARYIEPPKIYIPEYAITNTEREGARLKCIRTGAAQALGDGPPNQLQSSISVSVQKIAQ